MSELPSEPVFFEFLALRRVFDGGLTELDGAYVQHARPITGGVADALGRLLTAGLLALGPPHPSGHRTACVTATGQTALRRAAARCSTRS